MALGSKRLVVGAHYGVGDWLAQRMSAVIMAAYTAFLVITLLVTRNFSYDGWAGLFSHLWMKVVTLVALLALFYHAWIGVRDIWMDYVKPTGVRLTLQVLTILCLLFCAVWSVQILWRV
ncbi:MAG: succinate dehydrogenase, hydrophobic membrane anchor protein [Gemmatimonadota bacterium]